MFSGFMTRLNDNVYALSLLAEISQLEEDVGNGKFDELFVDLYEEVESNSEYIANNFVSAMIKKLTTGNNEVSSKFYDEIDKKTSSLIAETKGRVELICCEVISQEVFDDACERLARIITTKYMGAVLACRVLVETGIAFLPKHDGFLIEGFLFECADGISVNDNGFEKGLNDFITKECGYIFATEYDQLLACLGLVFKKVRNKDIQLKFVSDIVDEIIIQNQII